jgi:2-dehydro-3-deoxy-L-rhamnonate dehydrogenase (NAD+)
MTHVTPADEQEPKMATRIGSTNDRIWPERLAGKAILVTGAAGDLGTAICRRLHDEGATVIAADRTEPGHTGAALEVGFDVTDRAAWEHVVKSTEQRFSGLDGLVLAHGMVGAERPVADYPVDDWQRALDVNLTGCFHGLAAAIPAMVRSEGGRIAALASITGKEPNANQSGYSVSKAGLIALVKSAAREYSRSGVLINCLAPSVFNTSMAAQLSEDLRQQILTKVPMGRFGEPAELAALTAFLMSDDLTYTTGQVFDLSGGRAAY